MNCAYHADREMRGVCSSCGRPFCEECLVDLQGDPYCKGCLIARVRRPARAINGTIRFLLSVAPGFGHLYMGLLQRGFQFVLGTVLGGIVLGMVAPGLLGLYIPGAIFFSIFDARELHLRLVQGLPVEDKGLIDLQAVASRWNERHVGYALIALGGLALWRVLTGEVLRVLFPHSYWQLRESVNGATLGVAAIAAGVWLLRQNATSRS